MSCPCGGGQSCVVTRRELGGVVLQDEILKEANLPIIKDCCTEPSSEQLRALNSWSQKQDNLNSIVINSAHSWIDDMDSESRAYLETYFNEPNQVISQSDVSNESIKISQSDVSNESIKINIDQTKEMTETKETQETQETQDIQAGFKEKLEKSQLKHSTETKMTKLINHIARIITEKKDYLQKQLLRHPTEELVLMSKSELSNSYLVTKMVGLETYPYYVHPTQSLYLIFGADCNDIYDRVAACNGVPSKWSTKLRHKIGEILELTDVKFIIQFGYDYYTKNRWNDIILKLG
jgi:hypothetical protein